MISSAYTLWCAARATGSNNRFQPAVGGYSCQPGEPMNALPSVQRRIVNSPLGVCSSRDLCVQWFTLKYNNPGQIKDGGGEVDSVDGAVWDVFSGHNEAELLWIYSCESKARCNFFFFLFPSPHAVRISYSEEKEVTFFCHLTTRRSRPLPSAVTAPADCSGEMCLFLPLWQNREVKLTPPTPRRIQMCVYSHFLLVAYLHSPPQRGSRWLER